MGEAAESACHWLLLRLAGRLSDRLLWRFRDWLAAGALPELSHSVPLTLLRERIGLTTDELRLLDSALRPYGADVGLIRSIRELDEVPEPDFTFSPEPPTRTGLGDSHAVVLGAMLRDRPGIGEVRASWRRTRSGGMPRRILLVSTLNGAVALTGELRNVFDLKYATFGTFSEVDEVELTEAPGASDPRAYGPGSPRRWTVGLRGSF